MTDQFPPDRESLIALITTLTAERDAAGEAALDNFSREYMEAYGCDPVMMHTGRENWKATASTALLQVEALTRALETARADVLEEAAKLADDMSNPYKGGARGVAQEQSRAVAAALRSLSKEGETNG